MIVSESEYRVKSVNFCSEVQEAEKLKFRGNEAYEERDFATAMKYHKSAIELDPTNMTFYANMAAVYFEKSLFLECTDFRETAIDVCQLNLVDPNLISKAHKGCSYLRI